jgi:fructokinase
VARRTIVGIGEILWDVFGREKHLGGATANFAYHAAALGDLGITVSRIGRDRLGDELLAAFEQLGAPTEHIQRDARLKTGTVRVKVDEHGQPDFTIIPNVAWDNIQSTRKLMELAARADAVCFGSLAQRSPVSRRTVRRFVRAAYRALIVCDINLRGGFLELTSDDADEMEIVETSMRLADVLKLNDEELALLKSVFARDGSDDGFALWLMREFDLRMVCVTRGSKGCILRTRRKRVTARGVKVRVADAVGAGDAFTAAMVNGLLRRRPLADIAAFANRVGAYVASQPGATPGPAPFIRPRR